MKAFDTLSIFKLICSYKITSANDCLTWIDWYYTLEATDLRSHLLRTSKKILVHCPAVELQWGDKGAQEFAQLLPYIRKSYTLFVMWYVLPRSQTDLVLIGLFVLMLPSLPTSSPLMPNQFLLLFSLLWLSSTFLFFPLNFFFSLDFSFIFQIIPVIVLTVFNLHFSNEWITVLNI